MQLLGSGVALGWILQSYPEFLAPKCAMPRKARAYSRLGPGYRSQRIPYEYHVLENGTLCNAVANGIAWGQFHVEKSPENEAPSRKRTQHNLSLLLRHTTRRVSQLNWVLSFDDALSL